ncbi:MAG: hypothetical protein AAGU75_07325 [Bacillota bacterium]
MSKESYSSWCYGRPIGPDNKRWSSEEEFESKIKIITPVDIWQFGFANGGDANGGDGGNAVGGAAAAAFAESDVLGDANAIAAIIVSPDSEADGVGGRPNQVAAPGQTAAAKQALTADQAAAPNQAAETNGLLDDLDASLDAVLQGEGATAIGGDAAGGNGGNGGTGGAGGTVTNTAVVTTVNVIVFSNETENTPGLTIGTGSGNLDISSNESGTFVNGQKLDETALGDGTKVYIFRNSEVKK